MNVLIAPDKFKGTLSSAEVCRIIQGTLADSFPSSSIRALPLADGGDGTADVLRHYIKGRPVRVKVHDPLMRLAEADYLLSGDGTVAYIEMAAASGLVLLAANERNPLLTSSYGTGELLLHACHLGARHIFLGIGGSATNDGGAGALAALGFRFLDKNKKAFVPAGGMLQQITDIDDKNILPELRSIKFTALCDVTNPFTGSEGATVVFAPQKGADENAVKQLEAGMRHFAAVLYRKTGKELTIPGTGAGGGIAGGLYAMLGAELKSGINVVMELSGFEKALKWADVVITGEGKLDNQTPKGKAVFGAAQMARKHGKKVVVVCGRNELSRFQLKEIGIESVFQLVDKASEAVALKNPAAVLREVVRSEIIPLLKNLRAD